MTRTNAHARPVLPGTLELLVLRLLRDGPAHGFSLSRELRRRSGGAVELTDGALYQAVHRMENEGLVRADWGQSEKGKRAKFYQLTSAGAARLDTEAAAWHGYVDAVARVLGPDFRPGFTPGGGPGSMPGRAPGFAPGRGPDVAPEAGRG